MKRVAVIGHGYVGSSVARFFKNHFETTVFDPAKYKGAGPLDGQDTGIYSTNFKNTVNTCDLAVVCVPTPMAEDHSVDLSIIEETIKWLETPLILIKSTIPPGTTKALKNKFRSKKIVFSPEFIGEGQYVIPWWKDKGYPHATDMKFHDFQIFGGHIDDCIAVSNFFQRVVGPEVQMRFTDSVTAELCKYMENSFFATKVVFCNEFYDIAKTFGVRYEELRELWLLDGRMGRMHTAVFPDGRGFGGKCLPKDVNGLVEQSKKAGYTPKLLSAVLSVNEEIRKENEKKD